MASPLTNQPVDDLKQNFYWSYISQDEEHLEVVNLEMTVEQFLEYIEIDLDGSPYPPQALVSLYYGMNEKVFDSGVYYFTYLLANSIVNEFGVMVNLGIIDHSTEYLLLKEDGDYSAVNAAQYVTRTSMFKDAFIFSPYTEVSIEIESLTNHPLICSFPKEDFRNFINNNMTSPEMDLSTLKLVFQMGATLVTGVNTNYKVETALIITKDIYGLKLDSVNYTNLPFKYKAMDVGKLCPPNCID